MVRKAGIALAGLFALTVAVAGPSVAQTGAGELFKGKTVTIIVAGGPGGGYGLYASLFGDHFKDHLPGKPTFVPRFMQGGGGVIAANYLYNVAPRDGTHMGALLANQTMTQLLNRGEIKYDSAKFNWIGRISAINSVMVVRPDAPATTIEQMKQTEIVAAAAGIGSNTHIVPALTNYGLGTKIKIISGYKGSNGNILAYERGEAQAYAGSWSSLISSRPAHLKHILLVQFGLEKEEGYEKVPVLVDLVKDAKKKKIIELLSAEATIGRSICATPEVPAATVAALRTAFDQTMKDPAFLEKAKKANMDISPRPGSFIAEVVKKQLSVPADIVEEAKLATKAQ